VQHRLIVSIVIDEVDSMVGAGGEADIAHQRPGRKLAFHVHRDRSALLLAVQDGAGADVGNDLLRRDLHLRGRRIGPVALARDVLRVPPGEREIIGTGRSRGSYGEHQSENDEERTEGLIRG